MPCPMKHYCLVRNACTASCACACHACSLARSWAAEAPPSTSLSPSKTDLKLAEIQAMKDLTAALQTATEQSRHMQKTVMDPMLWHSLTTLSTQALERTLPKIVETLKAILPTPKQDAR